jgi:L-alanine-DL-glutamate epimerase-like enolase superfamily enzyme
MQETLSRRKFFEWTGKGAALAATAAGFSAASGADGVKGSSPMPSLRPGAGLSRPATPAAPAVGHLNLNVSKIQTTWVNVPFRPIPGRRMRAENYEWTYFQIHKVTLECGVVGLGETMPYYTWGRPTEAAMAYARGRNAAELMWDDSLGAGLQMALFDAVAKANDVPAYRLLGRKHRERAFISWWDLDMTSEDWTLECREAIALGYTDFKTKARPWRNLVEDCRALCRTLPAYFKLDMDFNDFLLDVSHATQVMQELAQLPNVAAFETPIPQGDVEGNRFLRSQTRVPIAMHYGVPPVMTALKEEVCDVFVVGGGARAVLRAAAVAAMANKTFWLQLVGTGITASFALHLAAVVSHATWPAVNCHQLYVSPLIKPGISVSNGTAAIPEEPGLGVDLDEDAISRHRIEPLARRPDPPDALIAVRWPTGATRYYAYSKQYWDDFRSGRLPVFASGVRMDYVEDDGSREWRELHERAKGAPVVAAQRVL